MHVARAADGVLVHLDADEASLVRELVRQMRAVIAQGDDPVLDRLFPDAYDDPQDQAAFKELVGDSLAQEKLARLDDMAAALGTSGSADAAADPDVWLTVLTDMRLALGVRLDVDEERMGTPIEPSDPDAAAMTVLHWLGWVQEEILQTLR